jgi:hypothetical protein
MSNCQLLARITTDRESVTALTYRLLLVAVALVPLDVLLAYPALSQEPLYVGDFDEPSDRKEYRPFELNRVDIEGDPFTSKESAPAGFPPKMIPGRAKSRLMCFKIESNSKGQLFIRPVRKRVKILGLPENKVRFFFGSPLSVRKYDKRVETANLDQVFEYPCHCDSRINKLILGFENKVVRRAVVVPLSSKAEE